MKTNKTFVSTWVNSRKKLTYRDLPSFQIAPFPFTVYMCLSDIEWQKVKVSLNCGDSLWITGNGRGANIRPLDFAVVLSINYTRDPEEVDDFGIWGFSVHEATHIFQHLCETIGEVKPSSEFEAYSIQYIATAIIKECSRRRQLDLEVK